MATREMCPDCPDGAVWNEDGPTNELCPTCNGRAFIFVEEYSEGPTPAQCNDILGKPGHYRETLSHFKLKERK